MNFGRILFLCADPERVRAQLAGRALDRAAAGALRNEISTDEITPLPSVVHFDATLGRHAHTGFTAGGERPIARDALRAAGIDYLANSGGQLALLTVEDPVEYQLEGISQVQVNPKIELTFASAIRSFLRHDPDVIIVGEIRDRETAEIAIQASLTGHLVLASLHTNTAGAAITRLTDMGVEPFLLSSSLLGTLAQRLVRKLCKHCGGPGCTECGHTGYQGRTGVFELLVTDEAIRAQIHNRASEAEIRDAALKAGMVLMRDDGERLVREGITSREELVRVTRE